MFRKMHAFYTEMLIKVKYMHNMSR